MQFVFKKKIQQYNLFGMKRNPQQLRKQMQQLAASVGGDAIVAANYHDHVLEAQIIAYQKILI